MAIAGVFLTNEQIDLLANQLEVWTSETGSTTKTVLWERTSCVRFNGLFSQYLSARDTGNYFHAINLFFATFEEFDHIEPANMFFNIDAVNLIAHTAAILRGQCDFIAKAIEMVFDGVSNSDYDKLFRQINLRALNACNTKKLDEVTRLCAGVDVVRKEESRFEKICKLVKSNPKICVGVGVVLFVGGGIFYLAPAAVAPTLRILSSAAVKKIGTAAILTSLAELGATYVISCKADAWNEFVENRRIYQAKSRLLKMSIPDLEGEFQDQKMSQKAKLDPQNANALEQFIQSRMNPQQTAPQSFVAITAETKVVQTHTTHLTVVVAGQPSSVPIAPGSGKAVAHFSPVLASPPPTNPGVRPAPGVQLTTPHTQQAQRPPTQAPK